MCNDCDPNPCLNSGTCTDLGVNDYNCTCTEDFSGKNCTDYIGGCPNNYITGEFLATLILYYHYLSYFYYSWLVDALQAQSDMLIQLTSPS